MKTTQKQFELFKKECRKWANMFELNGWRFDFLLDDLGKHQAEANVNYLGCVATIKLDIRLTKSKEDTWTNLVKLNAKHEIIHILLGNLATLGNSRFITSDEIVKAEEELVRKLENIIT